MQETYLEEHVAKVVDHAVSLLGGGLRLEGLGELGADLLAEKLHAILTRLLQLLALVLFEALRGDGRPAG